MGLTVEQSVRIEIDSIKEIAARLELNDNPDKEAAMEQLDNAFQLNLHVGNLTNYLAFVCADHWE